MNRSKLLAGSILLLMVLTTTCFAQNEITAADAEQVVSQACSACDGLSNEQIFSYIWYLAPAASLAALVVAFFFYKRIVFELK